MKKLLSLVLVLTMLLSLSLCFPVQAADEKTLVSNVQPAILATVGDTVYFSDYKVEFPGGSVYENCVFKDANTVVTSFKVTSSGVTALTAESGTLKKNVYIVAKNVGNEDYVLYENGFDDASSLTGFSKSAGDSTYTLADGKLTIVGTSSNPRIYLPAWLADFGNYRYDVVGTQTNPVNTSRWFSLVFRAQNMTASGASVGSPYMHMCVRNAATTPGSATTGGVEAVVNTGNWVYLKSTGYTENISPNKNYKFSVLAQNDVVEYRIDENVVIHISNVPKVGSSADYRGGLGLIGNQSNFVVDSVKVSILEDIPVYTEPKFVQVSDVASNILNAPANVAAITDSDALKAVSSATQKPSNAMLYVNDNGKVTDIAGAEFTSIADAVKSLGNNIIPAFYVKTEAAAAKVKEQIKKLNLIDVLIVASDPSIASSCRQSNEIYRSAIDFTSKYSGKDVLEDSDLFDIRCTVNSSFANICILPLKFATQHNVTYLRDLNIVVWVKDTDVDGVVDTATLISSGATGIITNDFASVYKFESEVFAKNTLTSTPSIIGHRGNPTNAPENSISGYLKAVENGADVVETDIQFTKDGVLVVMHDDCIARTTSYNGSLKVSQMTLAEIKNYSLWGDNNKFKASYPNEKVPTFEEMLIALKDVDCKIFVEIKTSDAKAPKAMAEIIKKCGFEDRCCVICFTASQLMLTQKELPGMSTGFLMNAISTYSGAERLAEIAKDTVKSVQACNSSFNPNYGNLNEAFVNALTYRGVYIWPWTYASSTSANSNQMFIYGAAGLTTNDAQYYKNTVERIFADASSLTVELGKTKSLTVKSHTYGDAESDISASAFYQILAGSDVISVDKGVITPLKCGTASVMVSYKTKLPNSTEYVLYTQPVTITVTESGDMVYLPQVKDDYLIGLHAESDKGALFDDLASVMPKASIEVKKASGEALAAGSSLPIATGDTVKIDGNTYTAVILGDVDCDGLVTAADCLMVKRYFFGSIKLGSDACLIAAGDSGLTGSVAAIDYLKIKRHCLGTYDLDSAYLVLEKTIG